MTPLFRKLLGLNWPLVFAMYGLLVFGVLSIESAARHLPQGGEWFANQQKKWILIGSVVYFATALIDYRWFRWLGLPLYIAGLAFTAIILGRGEDSSGNAHQFELPGGLNFQPAQLAIASGIVLLSWLLQDLPRLGRLIPKVGWILDEPWTKIAIIGICTGIPFLMVVAMGDIGSAIVWLPLAGVCLLVSGVPFRYLTFLGLVGLAALPLIYFIVLPQVSKRAVPRIEVYLDMLHGREVDIQVDAYDAYYVSMAVGKAGWKGLGRNSTADSSVHNKGFISQRTAHNDYIFGVIGEEQGFRGSLLLVTGFGLLLVLCLFIGTYARDPMGRILVGGVVALFFAHMFENIGMCVLLMPITGIPLPLISYSGTFVVMCMFLLGLVQSVWVHRDGGREAAVSG